MPRNTIKVIFILARIYPTEIRGFSVGVGRFGAILGPSLFGYFADNSFSTNALFTIFCATYHRLSVVGFECFNSRF
jgi:hypothetical protein